MKRSLILSLVVLILGMISGCSYFQKKDEPPPLPPIEETKPPLTMKSDYFKAFPWGELPSPKKDGNDPDTETYTLKEGETLEQVAESRMGDPNLAERLANYNELTAASEAKPGDKIVIPNPIIGVVSQIRIKGKKDKDFGNPEPFGAEFKAGDQYKLRFETNVDGYLYVFRKGVKTVEMLYPARAKVAKRGKKETKPLMRDTGKVKKNEAVEIPTGKGFVYNPKKAGDVLYVFLSLRQIPDLDDLKEAKTIAAKDVELAMSRVKEGEILNESPYHLLRISKPAEILGFTINIDG